MSKGIILWHIPIYILAILGLITIYFLASLPQGNRAQVSIHDGNIEYTYLDYQVSIGSIIDSINSLSYEQLPLVQKSLKREYPPRQSAIWIYISLDKSSPNVVLFHDYIFDCPTCYNNDIFDLYRTNYILNLDLGCYRKGGCYWRESLILSDYLIPKSSTNSQEDGNEGAPYDN